MGLSVRQSSALVLASGLVLSSGLVLMDKRRRRFTTKPKKGRAAHPGLADLRPPKLRRSFTDPSRDFDVSAPLCATLTGLGETGRP